MSVENTKEKTLTKDDYWDIKTVYPESELGEKVYNFLSQENHKLSKEKSKERINKIKFYPSSIGQSDYNIVMEMLGYIGKPLEGQSVMIMENGTSFHNRIEEIFDKMNILIAPELSLVDEELCISGRSDAIIWNYLREEDEEDGEEIELISPEGEVIYKGPENYVLLVEFKSISENGFEKLRKSKPKDEHEDQLQLYFYLTGITKGIIYYENKNNQKTKEYIVERDEEKIKAIISRIKRLIEMARNNEIPEVDYNPGDFKGKFSKFIDNAYPNSNPVEFMDIFQEVLNSDLEFPF